MRRIWLSLVIVFAFISFARAQNKDKCTTSWSGESGIYTKNYWDIVGEVFDTHPSWQGWIEVERCGNKKVSFGGGTYGALSTKENPGPGSELDVWAFASFHPKENFSARTDATVLAFEKGEKLYSLSETLTRNFTLTKKVEGTLTNITTGYWSNDADLKTGVVNKTAFTVSREVKKWRLALTPGVGIDNNPFDLGAGKIVAMGYLEARADYNVSKRWGLFGVWQGSRPLAGDTLRGPHNAIGVGIKFQF